MIEHAAPMTGRMMKEDGSLINIADLLSGVALVRKSGTSPASPSAGDLWVDTAGPTLKIYDGGSWVAV